MQIFLFLYQSFSFFYVIEKLGHQLVSNGNIIKEADLKGRLLGFIRMI